MYVRARYTQTHRQTHTHTASELTRPIAMFVVQSERVLPYSVHAIVYDTVALSHQSLLEPRPQTLPEHCVSTTLNVERAACVYSRLSHRHRTTSLFVCKCVRVFGVHVGVQNHRFPRRFFVRVVFRRPVRVTSAALNASRNNNIFVGAPYSILQPGRRRLILAPSKTLFVDIFVRCAVAVVHVSFTLTVHCLIVFCSFVRPLPSDACLDQFD